VTNNRILRLPDTLKKTGLSRSSLYLEMNARRFPNSIKLSERSVGWLEADIDNWIESRVQQSVLAA
jgi:prophage regulatory protein